jgi:predicted lysophospholipase L1 biosynthesis ABC-type transport system permease subunit
LGKHLASSEVVGVVGDVRTADLTVPPSHTVYLPMIDGTMGGGSRSWTVALRARTDPASLVPGVREQLRPLGPVLTNLRTYDEIIGDSTSRVSLTAALLLLSSIVALVLASIGVFGVISYVTSQRVSELAVRQALGAAPSRLLVSVLGHAVALAAMGLLIGAAAAAWLSGSLRTLVYGIETVDPPSFLMGSAVVVLSALAASLVPALRAFRLTPAQAMRHE